MRKLLRQHLLVIMNAYSQLTIHHKPFMVEQTTTKTAKVFPFKCFAVCGILHIQLPVQVANGVKLDLMIVVAVSTTCKKDSELCKSVECPIDESTKQLWIVSVVVPPTKLTTYNVLSIRQLVHIGSVSEQLCNNDKQQHFQWIMFTSIIIYVQLTTCFLYSLNIYFLQYAYCTWLVCLFCSFHCLHC